MSDREVEALGRLHYGELHTRTDSDLSEAKSALRAALGLYL